MSTDKNIFIDIWLLASLTDRLVAEILEDSRLAVDEFAMYGLISDLAPITAADLVRATGRSPTTISSLVRRCEARGELVRVDNPVDARSSLLELTPAGYQALSGTVPHLIDAIEAIKVGLGGKHDSVRDSLWELDQALRQRLGVGPRSYRLLSEPSDAASVSYEGEPLRPEQTDEVRRFIDWLRIRDGDVD
jgi:DNA-binding MarR family transcriptional regulator